MKLKMARYIQNNTNDFDTDKFIDEIWTWIEDVYFWPRSILNSAYDKTLASIEEKVGVLTHHTFDTGQKIGDWLIPQKWEAKNAYIKTLTGETLIDLKNSNLHLASYSQTLPQQVIKTAELASHLKYSSKIEDAIPYVTHYYSESWSFCVTKSQYEKIMSYDEVIVSIQSERTDSKIDVGEFHISGKSKKLINFNTYICHPSMANNELSGPALCILIAYYLKYIQQTKSLNYSYSIFWGPETIGAIALLSKNLEYYRTQLLTGFVLTCIGDEANFGFIRSRKEIKLSEKMIQKVLEEMHLDYNLYSFSDRGSDERQFCWPSVNLPYTCLFRSKFGTYREYHTSNDDLNFITKKGLKESFNVLKNLICKIENSTFPMTNTLGEPFLSKYIKYEKEEGSGPNMSAREIREFLSLCDGETDLEEIAQAMSISNAQISEHFDFCLNNNLINI